MANKRGWMNEWFTVINGGEIAGGFWSFWVYIWRGLYKELRIFEIMLLYCKLCTKNIEINAKVLIPVSPLAESSESPEVKATVGETLDSLFDASGSAYSSVEIKLLLFFARLWIPFEDSRLFVSGIKLLTVLDGFLGSFSSPSKVKIWRTFSLVALEKFLCFIWRKVVQSRGVIHLSALPWVSQLFIHFLTKRCEPFTRKRKLARLKGWPA